MPSTSPAQNPALAVVPSCLQAQAANEETEETDETEASAPPASPAAPDDKDALRESRTRCLAVLVLEPPVDGQPVVGGLSRSLGWEVETVAAASELQLRLTEATPETRAPDVVVIEPGPQDWASLRALTRIKQRPGQNALPPFVLVLRDPRVALDSSGLGGLADSLVQRPATAGALQRAVEAAVRERC